MTTRIVRGASASRGRRKTPAHTAGNRRASPRAALDDSPFSHSPVRRIARWLIIGAILAIAIAIASGLGLHRTAYVALGELIGRAGFAMERVEIKGAHHVPRLQIYNVAWDQPSTALPLVDLDETRTQLLRFSWIKEARVSRRMPDTLVIDLVERRPAAIWQHDRQLTLIDNEGVLLEEVRLEAMPDLPLVIGPDANRHIGELDRLINAAAVLKPMLAGASWIGGRRWDLRFQSGETLALPEGEAAASKALAQFVRMDQSAQLLGRGLVRFDMRIPGKFIVRVSREPGSIVPQAEPPASTDHPDPSTTI